MDDQIRESRQLLDEATIYTQHNPDGRRLVIGMLFARLGQTTNRRLCDQCNQRRQVARTTVNAVFYAWLCKRCYWQTPDDTIIMFARRENI